MSAVTISSLGWNVMRMGCGSVVRAAKVWVTTPAGEWEDAILSDEVRTLVGKSVGAICFTLNLPDEPPYHRIVNHAVEMHNHLMSAWSFVTQWADGTIWRDEEGIAIAFVSGDEVVDISLD